MGNLENEVVIDEQQVNSLESGTLDRGSGSRSIWSTIKSIIVLGVIGFLAFTWWNNNHNESQFYKAIYEQAENSIRNDFSSAANLKIDGYDKDRITQGRYEMHNFGEGDLRYAVFTVNIPTEYDAPLGHMEIAPNITVYYYTSDQNVSEGIDTSVSPHFYTVGVNDSINNAFYEMDQQMDEAIDNAFN